MWHKYALKRGWWHFLCLYPSACFLDCKQPKVSWVIGDNQFREMVLHLRGQLIPLIQVEHRTLVYGAEPGAGWHAAMCWCCFNACCLLSAHQGRGLRVGLGETHDVVWDVESPCFGAASATEDHLGVDEVHAFRRDHQGVVLKLNVATCECMRGAAGPLHWSPILLSYTL